MVKKTKTPAAATAIAKQADKNIAAININAHDDVLNLVTLADRKAAAAVSEKLVEIKTAYKMLETDRKSITAPLLKSKKAIDAKYKPVTSHLVRLEDHIKALLVQFIREAEAVAAKKVEKEAKRAEKKGALQLAETIRTSATNINHIEAAGVETRRSKKVVVCDIKKLCAAVADGSVGSSIISVDNKELQRLIDSPPPGCEIENVTTIAASSF